MDMDVGENDFRACEEMQQEASVTEGRWMGQNGNSEQISRGMNA